MRQPNFLLATNASPLVEHFKSPNPSWRKSMGFIWWMDGWVPGLEAENSYIRALAVACKNRNSHQITSPFFSRGSPCVSPKSSKVAVSLCPYDANACHRQRVTHKLRKASGCTHVSDGGLKVGMSLAPPASLHTVYCSCSNRTRAPLPPAVTNNGRINKE